jgi:hypothetical protein
MKIEMIPEECVEEFCRERISGARGPVVRPIYEPSTAREASNFIIGGVERFF